MAKPFTKASRIRQDAWAKTLRSKAKTACISSSTILARNGSANVVAFKNGSYFGATAFGNVTDEIASVEWMDNGESLSFTQDNNMLTINATGFPYGMSTCVRVAKAKLK